MFNNVLDGFYLVDWYRILFEIEEVADEDRFFFLVDKLRELFVFSVIASACGKLKCSDGFGVPGVAYAVFAPVELSEVGQEVELLAVVEGLVVHADCVAGDGFESNAAYSAHFCTEVGLQQRLRQTYALEYLGSAI